jgi:DNA-binding GntR family transcriptional regulator
MSNRCARETWDEHATILAAVIDGDEELPALLAVRHVNNAGADALTRFDQP